MSLDIRIETHPDLRVGLFRTHFARPLGELKSPDWLTELFVADAPAPLQRDEAVRTAVRDLLRHGGYKLTGRGKPASEYLVRAAERGSLGTINLAVDACNAVSLHSGFPISVVDLERAAEPLHIAIAAKGVSYVFNPTGQEIDLSGLLCLFDRDGPCANAVKDAQRTKTNDGTTTTLSVMWACTDHADRLERGMAWYRELLERAGGETEW